MSVSSNSFRKKVHVLILSLPFFIIPMLWLLFIKEHAPPGGNYQQASPSLQAQSSDNVGRITVTNATSDTSVPVVEDAQISIAITPPVKAQEMQIGFDPTFLTTPWVPLESTAQIQSAHQGYQTIFARFREGTQTEPTEPTVTGVNLHRTYSASAHTASAGKKPLWVRPLSTKILLVRIQNGVLQWGEQQAYDFDNLPAGDSVSRGWGIRGSKLKKVYRNDIPYAEQVSGYTNRIRTYDTVIGALPFEEKEMQTPWVLTTSNGETIPTQRVETITRSTGSGRQGDQPILATTTDFVLFFDTELQPETQYTLAPTSEKVPVQDTTYTFVPNETITAAIHLNQAGYGTTDNKKVAYLGGWHKKLPELRYDDSETFTLRDASERAVYTGNLEKHAVSSNTEIPQVASPVYKLDFSSFTTPGTYTLCIPKVGCSETFTISENPWKHAAIIVARSAYHQRSGIALGPPYTSIQRPRPYHPDDGSTVYKSTFSLFESKQENVADIFPNLVKNSTEQTIPDAWGGHHDAGDWDRRIEHLWYARAAIDLLRTHPDSYRTLSLNIPESQNTIPDILDEGLWTLDFYHRLQHSSGAISGGIEAAEHPLPGTTSWIDSLELYQYHPDRWSSYLYASVAAEYAAVLETYEPERAQVYKQSAIAAMQWADSQPDLPEPNQQERVSNQRAVAAAALFMMTNESKWETLFHQLTPFDTESVQLLSCHQHELCDAGWIYLQATSGNPQTRKNIEESFDKNATALLEFHDQNPYSWGVEHPEVPLIWGLGAGGAPKTLGLLRAYEITGKQQFLDAAFQIAGFSLGANPTDTVFVTGMGKNPVRYPLILDSENGALPIWPGTPVYGHHWIQNSETAAYSWVSESLLSPAGISPLPEALPYLWQWQEAKVPFFTEFTIHQSHAPAVQTFGSLAAITENQSETLQ